MLETFEYFCQISSKAITIILSYTVSKLVHFLRHSVFDLIRNVKYLHSTTVDRLQKLSSHSKHIFEYVPPAETRIFCNILCVLKIAFLK